MMGNLHHVRRKIHGVNSDDTLPCPPAPAAGQLDPYRCSGKL